MLERSPTVPRGLALALALIASLVTTAPAGACPSCAAGRQARSEVWNDDFGFNLVVALLPFLVIGVICVGAEAIGRSRDDITPRRRLHR